MTGFRLGCSSSKKDKLSPPGLQKPTALVDEVSAPSGFGIRSYLHQFYQSPTVEDIEQSGAWYLLPPPPAQRRGLFICRIVACLGFLLLICGAGAILFSFLYEPESVEKNLEKIIVYVDEEGSYYIPQDKLQTLLQDPMKYWKTYGFIAFTSGAILLAVSLMIPVLASCIGHKRLAGFMSEDNSPNEPPVRIYPERGPIIAASSGPVPVMEEIAKVQPNEKTVATVKDLMDTEDAPLVH